MGVLLIIYINHLQGRTETKDSDLGSTQTVLESPGSS